jgi:hypothetical protein
MGMYDNIKNSKNYLVGIFLHITTLYTIAIWGPWKSG